MWQHEVDAAGDHPSNKIPLTGNESWFIDRVWEGRTDLMTTIPEHWKARPKTVDLHVAFDWDGTPEGLKHHITFCVRLKPTGQIAFPPQYIPYDYYRDTPAIRIGFTPTEVLPAEFQTCYEYAQRVKEINTRWKKVIDQVSEFMQSCKSLNEALKLWPDLRVYIPKTHLERIEKKSERKASESTAAEVLSRIDTDQIQASAVIARMSGAAV